MNWIGRAMKVFLLVALLVITLVNAYYTGDAIKVHAWSIASLYGLLSVIGFGYLVKWKRDL